LHHRLISLVKVIEGDQLDQIAPAYAASLVSLPYGQPYSM
jgi:hypothetical protein